MDPAVAEAAEAADWPELEALEATDRSDADAWEAVAWASFTTASTEAFAVAVPARTAVSTFLLTLAAEAPA